MFKPFRFLPALLFPVVLLSMPVGSLQHKVTTMRTDAVHVIN